MDQVFIRPYKKRDEMTYYQLEEHKRDLTSKKNKRAYIKRKLERMIFIDGYNEIVEAIEILNDNGCKIDRDLINGLLICEQYLDYEPKYIIE